MQENKQNKKPRYHLSPQMERTPEEIDRIKKIADMMGIIIDEV